ncbi:hypothetical protein J6590_024301 [Homalodisca vitripennis]|nr:hypothetical protein J6590_024301 [Homalodisca vitripennis]
MNPLSPLYSFIMFLLRLAVHGKGRSCATELVSLTKTVRTEVVSHVNSHNGSHPATIHTVSLSLSPSGSWTASSTLHDLPLSPLISQVVAKRDLRNVSTMTDDLFIRSKDALGR